MGTRGSAGIPFGEFESTVAKIRHAFTCIPAGQGLLSPCNRLLRHRPAYVYLQRNQAILTAIKGCQTMLSESTTERWKGVCVHQEANGEAFNRPVKALACQVIHICENSGDQKALLSAIYVEGVPYNVTGDDISKVLKMAGTLLNYPST